MKRKLVKIVLHRETLRQLDSSELAEAAGGLTTNQHTCAPHCSFVSCYTLTCCFKCPPPTAHCG
jgi:hypothetical protein